MHYWEYVLMHPRQFNLITQTESASWSITPSQYALFSWIRIIMVFFMSTLKTDSEHWTRSLKTESEKISLLRQNSTGTPVLTWNPFQNCTYSFCIFLSSFYPTSVFLIITPLTRFGLKSMPLFHCHGFLYFYRTDSISWFHYFYAYAT